MSSDMVKYRAAFWSFLKLAALVFYHVWHSLCRAWVRNLKLRVPLVTWNELCWCQLVLRTSKSEGARGDVQNFGGCQAPVAPVLTQALLHVESGEVSPHIMKILFAVSQKCPKQVVSLEFWGSFYSSSNSFILSPKLRAKVLLSQYILWPCLFLLPYLRFTKALISSHLYQIRGSVGTIGHVHIRCHFILNFFVGISIQNVYNLLFLKYNSK